MTVISPDPRGAALKGSPLRTNAASARPSRNLVVQIMVMALVTGVALGSMPWPAVLVWDLFALGVAIAEDQLFRHAASGGLTAGRGNMMAPALRAVATTTYAVAAFGLIQYGDTHAQLFAFAVMACSMVYVLMRYYRSPFMILASITPYMAILALVGFDQARQALSHHQPLHAISSAATIAVFGLLFWAARAQLAASATELMNARDSAEGRERAAAAANRAKSHFLATMSHELRTPLNAVLGMAQALKAEPLTDVQQERVRIIRRSGEDLLAVLNDLLDLSKIEASALELEVGEFDLEHLVRGVAAAFQPGANKKGLAFDFEITKDALGRFQGDSARIRRILYNLCANAVKFTEAGRINLSVDREAQGLVFRVADTGQGIAPAAMAYLFEDFFQADASLTRRHGGAGLGLALCRNLASLMEGTIEAESEVGQGSTFIVRLPVHPVEAQSELARAEPSMIEATGDDDLSVLAAEDNAVNQLVLQTLLAQAGLTPTFAGNGREALAAWERQDWDVILMDIQMPEMDGVAATRAIRLREAETGRPRTPILAVTANAMAHQMVEYEAAGMDGVVAKPIEATRLFAAMEQAVNQADAARTETRQTASAA